MITTAESLRSELLDASVRLLHGGGVADLTTRDIAREAGCSPGALYRHFATKTDLLAAVTQERLPNLRDQLGDLLGRVGSSSVERNLEHIIQATQRFVAELVPIVTAVAADRDLRAGWRRAFDGDVIPPRETLDAVAAYIAAEQRIGRVGAHASPLMSASMLIGACFSNAIVEHIFGETAHGMSPERHARALARAVWKGLAP